MAVTQITNYSELNTNPFLIEFFKDSNMTGILEACDQQFNDLEASMFSFFSEMWIADAVGAQLDVLGEHLQLSRNGRSDVDYKSLLLVKAQVNVKSGEPETIIKIARELYGATSVLYTPDYPGKFTLTHNGTLDFFIQDDAAWENDDGWELENGDDLEFQTEDTAAKEFIFNAIPSGVGIEIIVVP